MEATGRNDLTNAELAAACGRMEVAGTLLLQLAKNGRAGHVPAPTAITAAIVHVVGARDLLHGAQPRLPGSARDRILDHFREQEGEIVSADELAQVAGIHAWARRVRELRDEGHDIEHLGSGRYRFRFSD